MSEATLHPPVHDQLTRWHFIKNELKPKGSLLTPFNLLSLPIMILGLILIVIRFWKGLGAVTNLDQATPWGLWIGFDVVTGVAFAGGAYVITFMVYILRMETFRPIVRVTVLNGFLAYLFYAGALLLDLGKPWHVINPIIGNGFGTSSVLFLVAWHFLLYMIAELIEFSPAIAEWLNARKLRRVLTGLSVGAVVFGITLSTLHQSGLGALFLMAKPKIHPLWYSEFIPIMFFVSSIFAGLSMVIFEGTITNKVFRHRLGDDYKHKHHAIITGLSKVCAIAMFAYLFLKILDLVHGQHLADLLTPWGSWFLVEILGFVALPMILFIQGLRSDNTWLIKVAAIFTLLGVMLNRLNISVIAFNWDAVNPYYPTWMEYVVTLAIIFTEIWIFRWIIQRMPVLKESPLFPNTSH